MTESQLWGIEVRQQISASSDARIILWYLDSEAGLFADYELAAEEVSRRNQAERIRLEGQLEQDYQKRLGAWRNSVIEHEALAVAGLRKGPAVGLMEPQRGRCVHTDLYRVSQALSVHSRP